MPNNNNNNAVAMKAPNLLAGFGPACSWLRTAWASGALRQDEDASSNQQEDTALPAFFELLTRVEAFSLSGSSDTTSTTSSPLFVIAVEGLDGSGKSSLVQSLAAGLQDDDEHSTMSAVAVATPTASLRAVRPVFDKVGGRTARAFYMVSNYVLHYEILQLQHNEQEQYQNNNNNNQTTLVVVIDRWYASTVAYSVAYGDHITTGGAETIDAMPSDWFRWAPDLLSPDLLLVLQVDDAVRRARVRQRALAPNHNPWDDRLDRDAQLAQRIQRALERIQLGSSGSESVAVNANPPQQQVLADALSVVRDRMRQKFQPLQYYQRQPLAYFGWSAARRGLCGVDTASKTSNSGSRRFQRKENQPWALQLASNAVTKGAPPSLQSVAIMEVDPDSGVLFFTRGHLGDGRDENAHDLVSVVSILGTYPDEQHWRADGFLCPVSLREFQLMNSIVPPNSLQSSDSSRSVAHGWRFVPLRMEILLGGSSGSPNDGPERYEWTRNLESSTDNPNGWSQVRKIYYPSSIPNRPFLQAPLLPITVAITGTHCSGKGCIGKKMVEILQTDENNNSWSFHCELGAELRETVVAAGHRIGDGSGSHNRLEWERTIHSAETARDDCQRQNQSLSRAVETWHVGNLSWRLLRSKAPLGSAERELYLSAIRHHQQDALVLFVHLSIPLEVSMERRSKDSATVERVPMKNDTEECSELLEHLEEGTQTILDDFHKELGIPTLILDNSKDGQAAIEETTCHIVQFINENQWRRAFR